MECSHRDNFLPFWANILFLVPPLTPNIKIWKKCKKTSGHIILLHMRTIDQDHMMYGSWDMKFKRQNFLIILGNLSLFYALNTLKNEKYQNWQNVLLTSSFYISVSKIIIICYTVLEIWYMTDVTVICILCYQAFFEAFFYNE